MVIVVFTDTFFEKEQMSRISLKRLVEADNVSTRSINDIRIKIKLDDQGSFSRVDLIGVNNHECKMEIQNLLSKASRSGVFEGNKAFSFEYRLEL